MEAENKTKGENKKKTVIFKVKKYFVGGKKKTTKTLAGANQKKKEEQQLLEGVKNLDEANIKPDKSSAEIEVWNVKI